MYEHKLILCKRHSQKTIQTKVKLFRNNCLKDKNCRRFELKTLLLLFLKKIIFSQMIA